MRIEVARLTLLSAQLRFLLEWRPWLILRFAFILLFARHSRSVRLILAAFALWLVSAFVVASVLVASEISRLRRDFTAQSDATYEIIRQRLDQNEAVLAGIDSMLHTFPGVESAGLRDYSQQMLARYPHIYMIELQPRVEEADLSRFEAWARKAIYPQFYVKDYGYGGERHWHPVSARPTYYPITFMEPQSHDALPVLGLDVYADNKFRAAIDETIRTGKPSISAPFDLYEGGRAYLIFKAVYAHEPDDLASRPRLASRVVSMLIHTGKFLSRNEMPSSLVSMRIYEQRFSYDQPDGLIDRVDAKPVPAWIRRFTPEFVYRKTLPSQIQPFVFETRQQLGAEVIPVLPVVLALIITFVISLLALVIYQQQIVSRRIARETERQMYLREEQAQVARLHTMGEMASGIAHELNQPLAAILSYNQACVRMLHESNPDLVAIEGAMKSMTDQAKRAADIIVRLRAFVSKRPAQILPLDMGKVLESAHSLAEPWLRQGAVVVNVDIPAKIPDVLADSVQIEQVVLNLIRNAVEAMDSMPAGSRVLSLALKYDERAVTLLVRDTGPGVSEDVRKMLFHPFHTSKADGMGLGLTICQSIAETYGGTVVENPAISFGAEFQLILPIRQPRDLS
ncbi:CHASE domain-containing protein [Paraburkholderia silvatlantica]|uniref:CHASE domain-containing protein n=1 Tax=Paraburkholderia silvatlantica TaxID=321895 RepID=UPI001060D9F3|nr:CHASE domain-containing protein [Paraburkholderia silvatlantica]TDR04457.1 phospho-acceptor domain-containing protein [Paraburkholderia silvatlantica]